MKSSPLVGLALSCALGLLAASASAEDGKALFDDALKASQRGDTATACDLFERSYKLEAAGGTLLNVASCRETRGDLIGAYNAFEEVRARSTREGKADRAELAKTRASALEARVARISVTLTEPLAAGHSFAVDGKPTPNLAEHPIAVEPGTHAVSVQEGSAIAWSVSAAVSLGALATVQVPALERPNTQRPSQQSASNETPTSSGSGRKTAGIVIGAIGVLSLGACAITGALAMGKHSDAEEKAKTDPRVANQISDEGRSIADVSTITGIVGGVALGAGIILFATAPSSRSGSSAARIELTPLIGKTQGASLRARF